VCRFRAMQPPSNSGSSGSMATGMQFGDSRRCCGTEGVAYSGWEAALGEALDDHFLETAEVVLA